MAIKAVIFDMDGTLVDSETVSAAAWHRTARSNDIEIPDSLIRQFIGRNYVSCRSMLIDHVGGVESFADELLVQHLQDFFDIAETNLELMDGARECLAALHEMGLPLALATSTRRDWALPRLQRFNMQGDFVTITCGDDVKKSKPEPDIFLAAAKSIDVDPTECAVIEDSHNGVRSGYAAGAQVFMIPDIIAPTQEIEDMCTAVLKSLHELPAAIAAVR